jgi:hypothetical protein
MGNEEFFGLFAKNLIQASYGMAKGVWLLLLNFFNQNQVPQSLTGSNLGLIKI